MRDKPSLWCSHFLLELQLLCGGVCALRLSRCVFPALSALVICAAAPTIGTLTPAGIIRFDTGNTQSQSVAIGTRFSAARNHLLENGYEIAAASKDGRICFAFSLFAFSIRSLVVVCCRSAFWWNGTICLLLDRRRRLCRHSHWSKHLRSLLSSLQCFCCRRSRDLSGCNFSRLLLFAL
mgnify:CR=1 FL=1